MKKQVCTLLMGLGILGGSGNLWSGKFSVIGEYALRQVIKRHEKQVRRLYGRDLPCLGRAVLVHNILAAVSASHVDQLEARAGRSTKYKNHAELMKHINRDSLTGMMVIHTKASFDILWAENYPAKNAHAIPVAVELAHEEGDEVVAEIWRLLKKRLDEFDLQQVMGRLE